MMQSQRSRSLVVAVLSVVNLLVLASPQIVAQDTTHPSVGQVAINAVLRQVALDPSVRVPKTDRRLPANGVWSIAKDSPISCPTDSRCVTVIYSVPEAGVSCQWDVALSGNEEGTILDQNEDASRYMVRVLRQDEAKVFVVWRKEPEYPPMAILAHLDGEVVLRVSVSAKGMPEKVEVVRASNPMFRQAATDAADQWKFKPLFVGSQAIRFQTAVRFVFLTSGPESANVTSTP